ncbi:4'-phosphopantetheinyl transferase superfamily protein [Microbacterium trichothecenolyticum]|uniref:4'-phosphopantetheinyl transferase superfamily protein n=1 Tax=Microbacterium trichothecenolyticum TaxID=69370 RepID=UPI0037C877BE
MHTGRAPARRWPADRRSEGLAHPVWAVKESYAKALGAGLALDFRGVDAARLRHSGGVRGVLTPSSGLTRAKIAVSWVAAAPSCSPSSVRAT